MKTQAQRLGALFFDRIEKMLADTDTQLTAAEYEMVRKVLSDNSITLSQVERGDFGKLAQSAAKDFPTVDTDPDYPFQDSGPEAYIQ